MPTFLSSLLRDPIHGHRRLKVQILFRIYILQLCNCTPNNSGYLPWSLFQKIPMHLSTQLQKEKWQTSNKSMAPKQRTSPRAGADSGAGWLPHFLNFTQTEFLNSHKLSCNTMIRQEPWTWKTSQRCSCARMRGSSHGLGCFLTS